MIPFFQQFTGINTITFYATELFDVLGDGANAALLNTAIVGSTILAIILVDRYCLLNAVMSYALSCPLHMISATQSA